MYDSALDDYWQPYKADCSLVLSDYTQFATAIVRNHCFSDMHTVLAIRSVVQKLIQTPGIPALSRRLLLLSYLKKNGVYREPEANVIGRRWEVKRDKSTSKQRQVEVDDIFYYVPIENTLKLVLQQPRSWSLIDRRGEQACSGVVTGWLHGSNGLQLRDYCAATFPLSIPIFVQIYFDEVETVNPFASKMEIHKLGAFYFVIKNFPAAANSSLHNIHHLALAIAKKRKKYTAEAVMCHTVAELKDLHDV